MQLDPAPRLSKPLLHELGMMIGRVLEKDITDATPHADNSRTPRSISCATKSPRTCSYVRELCWKLGDGVKKAA